MPATRFKRRVNLSARPCAGFEPVRGPDQQVGRPDSSATTRSIAVNPPPSEPIHLAHRAQKARARAERRVMRQSLVKRRERGERRRGREPSKAGEQDRRPRTSRGRAPRDRPACSWSDRPSSPRIGTGTKPRRPASASQPWTSSRTGRGGPSSGQARATRTPDPEPIPPESRPAQATGVPERLRLGRRPRDRRIARQDRVQVAVHHADPRLRPAARPESGGILPRTSPGRGREAHGSRPSGAA